MSSEPSPAFQFYWRDWRASRKVQAMNFAQRGMYLELLLEQWDVGSVPSTPVECAALLGGTTNEWQRSWPKIKACFTTKKTNGRSVATGRMINLKLEAVRLDRLRYKKAQAESGLRGAQKRWKRDGQPIGSPSNPEGKPIANDGSGSSSSPQSSSPSPHSTPAPDGASAGERAADTRQPERSDNGTVLQERFDVFWSAYPKKVAKDAARKAWQKRRPDDELVANILAALDWQRRQDNWLLESGRFIPNPSTYLNQGRWQDEQNGTPRMNDRTMSIARAGEEFLNG